MDKVLIGNGLCNNDYIHAYIGHDLYKPLSEFTPSMCSGNIHSLFPGYQQMSYCKKKKKFPKILHVRLICVIPGYLGNPQKPQLLQKDWNSLKSYYEIFHSKSLSDYNLCSTFKAHNLLNCLIFIYVFIHLF